MSCFPTRMRRTRRRGVVAVLVVISLLTLMGMAALTVDVGMVYRARQELQQAADAAALAGAWELLDEDRLRNAPDMSEELIAARQQSQYFASLNSVINAGPNVQLSDIQVGYLHDLTDPNESLSFTDPNQANTAFVLVRRDSVSNGPVDLFFAAILGYSTADVTASAAASFKDGVTGYRATPESGNAELLPLALHVNAWNAMMDRTWSCGDDWRYDEDSASVQQASDDLWEMNIYPGGGVEQLPPGNFGTVDIGSPNNSAADIARQLLEGVSAEDLGWFGEQLQLGEDGTLLLNGDTGLSAGIKDELAAIIGLPRAVPLYDQISGNGNNTMFRIVGFGGIRIMDVKLTGSMSSKRVIVQPAFVIDDAALVGPGSGPSHFIYRPVQLVR